MKQTSMENIYNDILLLSDSDRYKLYNRIKKEFYQDRARDKEIVAYTTAGKPLSKKQYIEKIEKAIAEADRNELITDDELEKEIVTW